MSKVFSALSVSVDGYITGRDPGAGRGLGDADHAVRLVLRRRDTECRCSMAFRLSEPSARVFDAVAARVGASLVGRNTYDDSGWSTGGTPHPDGPAGCAQPSAAAAGK